jgi:hypothetical protein
MSTDGGFMKHRLPLVSLGLLMAAAGAQAQELGTFRAELTGFEEVPALSSPARGHIRMSVAPDGSSVSWVLQYAGIPTAVLQAHIHFGQMSVNGGISVFLCTNLGNGPAGTQACPQEGTVTGTFTAGDVVGPGAQGIGAGDYAELIAALRAGVTYANVHSTERPGGEIRGQLSPGGGRVTSN